jgi:hypothetical protein
MVAVKLVTPVLVIWIPAQSRMNALSRETMRAPGWAWAGETPQPAQP